MNEHEFADRVAEWAARTGNPVPPIVRVDGLPRTPSLWLEPAGPVGPMLFVRHRANELLPDFAQVHLIAEEFVQARFGKPGYLRRVNRLCNQVLAVIVLVVVLVAHQLINDLPLFMVVVTFAGATLAQIVPTVVYALGWRWFMRKVNREMVEVLGRQHLVQTLQWYATQPPRPDLWWTRPSWQWWRDGAVPTARAQLRQLGASVTD